METRNRNLQTAETTDDANGVDVPSGFILKLYQMVNGAPDEVISVSVHHDHTLSSDRNGVHSTAS